MHRRAEAVRMAVRPPRKPGMGVRENARDKPESRWALLAWLARWRPVRRLKVSSSRRASFLSAFLPRARWARRLGLALAVLLGLCSAALVGLWVLLATGPISFDFATPWLKAAIAANFGDQIGVEVGGTVLERDEHGRTAMRMRDVVVRDHDGSVIASAPKAEIGFSSTSLLGGSPRAERLNLVGAELAVRVERDGRVTVSAGANKRPLAVTPALPAIEQTPTSEPRQGAERADGAQEYFAAFLAWIDRLGAFGLDGGDLTEVGLKSGNLVVDDLRNGRQSRFENIHLSLTRPRAGAFEFQLGSENAARPWLLKASLTPGYGGAHNIDVEATELSIRDLLLALRVDAGSIETEGTISAAMRAAIDPDGTAQYVNARVLVGQSLIADANDAYSRIGIDRAEMTLDWNGDQHALTMPFQIVSGGTRMTLVARADAPRDASGNWGLSLTGGSVVLPPQSPGDEPLQLSRIAIHGRLDTAARRLNFIDAEASGKGVGVAMSGSIDYSTSDPHINLGLASRNMSVAALKQLWPPFINTPVRSWIIERTSGGTVEQAEIATNAPLSTLRSGGPPVPDDGLYIQITTNGSKLRPFDELPDIRDADLVTRIKGRNATVSLGHGYIELPSGRRLTLANGTFEVPDTDIKNPPAKVRIRMDGPVAAAAELLNLDRLRDAASVPLDPAASRGNVVAVINLGMPLSGEVKANTLNYAISADIVNFSADRFLLGQKVEAQTMRATANNQGYQIKGDMRIGGAPASIELRHNSGESDSDLRLVGTLDDAARSRFGFDPSGGLSGAIPIKVGGRVAFGGDQENRLFVEADLTPVRIDNLFPGWVKPSGRSAHANWTYVAHGKSVRLDDVVFDGGGASLRGGVEFDQNGEFAAATFTTFALNDGDRASLRLERTPDNLYRAILRGDAFDARGFVKSSMTGAGDTRARGKPGYDFDLDAKIASVTGYKSEVLRGVDLHLLRRAGIIRGLTLNAKFANDGTLQGELKTKAGEKPTVLIQSNDAGALFRFTDIYSRMVGGQVAIQMEPPTVDGARQEGRVEAREFTVLGEQGLDGVAANAPNLGGNGVQFSHMRVRFTRSPGKMSIHEGIVDGPTIGATIDGIMDYAGNELHLRGTFVPLYALNSMFQDVPIVGILLGGKEGLIGSMTYEVVGSPGNPVLHVNPITVLAPGILRKFLEFPSSLPDERVQDPWRN